MPRRLARTRGQGEVSLMPNKPQMLEGYRVLDFSQFVAGPTCSRILAEMGAEVIKVEIAPEGDRTRSAGLKPLDGKHKSTTHSTYYMQHNHSKLSIALDLKKPAARELRTGAGARVRAREGPQPPR